MALRFACLRVFWLLGAASIGGDTWLGGAPGVAASSDETTSAPLLAREN